MARIRTKHDNVEDENDKAHHSAGNAILQVPAVGLGREWSCCCQGEQRELEEHTESGVEHVD